MRVKSCGHFVHLDMFCKDRELRQQHLNGFIIPHPGTIDVWTKLQNVKQMNPSDGQADVVYLQPSSAISQCWSTSRHNTFLRISSSSFSFLLSTFFDTHWYIIILLAKVHFISYCTVNTYDLLSCERDFFSACWWNLIFLTILALKSSNPLEGRNRALSLHLSASNFY